MPLMLSCCSLSVPLEVALDASIGQLPETFELFTYVVPGPPRPIKAGLRRRLILRLVGREVSSCVLVIKTSLGKMTIPGD